MANPIIVGGVETFSTVDFPEKISAVIFMQGCPWRCPFCYNHSLQPLDSQQDFNWPKFIDFLKTRKAMLDGVVFSGGEPLVQTGLAEAIKEVKDLGFEIGLHTGGYNPEHLREVLPLVDWVGLDIKAPFEMEKYKIGVGGPNHLKKVQKSLDLLLNCGIDFECRTTCDPRILMLKDIYDIADELKSKGVKKYFLQKYRPIESDKVTTDIDCEKFFLDQNLIKHLQSSFEVFDIRK